MLSGSQRRQLRRPRMHGIWRDILLSRGLFDIEGKIKRLVGQITRKVDSDDRFMNRARGEVHSPSNLFMCHQICDVALSPSTSTVSFSIMDVMLHHDS